MSLQTHEPEPPLDEEPEPPIDDEQEPEPESDEPQRAADPKERAELQLVDKRQSLIDTADSLEVVDASTYEQAAELAKTFAGWIKEAEAHFNPDIEAANKLHKSLCQKRSDFLQPLLARLDALKSRASSWWRSEEEKRLAEQRRLEEADRQKRVAEQRRLEEEAAKAKQAGDVDRAIELKEEATAVASAPPPPKPAATQPTVKGFSPKRENWTFEVHDKRAFLNAVTGVDLMLEEVDRRVAALRDKETPENADPITVKQDEAVYAALIDLQASLKAVSPRISIEAAEPCDVYLRGRAKTDKNTLKWPGVRFWDKGSVAVRS